jgi:hypothetical protein
MAHRTTGATILRATVRTLDAPLPLWLFNGAEVLGACANVICVRAVATGDAAAACKSLPAITFSLAPADTSIKVRESACACVRALTRIVLVLV